jgi:tetratricopeptide (TPR) repeat protein
VPMSRKITVYDEAGRPMQIDAERWADEILPGLLTEAWDDAETLAQRILGAIDDGFAERVLRAAEHLVAIDERPDRAASLLALVHTRLEEIDVAEGMLLRFLADHGDSALVLAQLGEIELARGDESLACTLFRRALAIDPNCVFALEQWLQALDERGGEAARHDGLRELAALEGSFWPQILIAREHLDRGDVRGAERIYDGVWDRLVDDGAALVRLSGDLGATGYPDLVLSRVAPVWDLERHGPVVGLNLVRACLDLGELTRGREILRRIDALGMPQFAEEVVRLQSELAAAQRDEIHRELGTVAEPMRVAVVPFDGPVWSACFNEAGPLVAPAVPAGASIGLLALADVRATERGRPLEEEDIVEAGRVSRALMLHLSEVLTQRTDARAVALIPVVRGAGPILAGEAWDREWFLSEIPEEHRPDVLVHGVILDGRIELRAEDTREGAVFSVLRFEPAPGGLAPSLSMTEAAVQDALERAGVLRPRARPSRYCMRNLEPEFEGLYLRLVDQLHAQILVAGGLVGIDSIADETMHMRAAFDFAEETEDCPSATLLACGQVLAAIGYRSPTAKAFKEPLLRLLRREGPGGTLWRLADYVEERL